MRYKRRCAILLPMALGALLLCIAAGCSNDAGEGFGLEGGDQWKLRLTGRLVSRSFNRTYGSATY